MLPHISTIRSCWIKKIQQKISSRRCEKENSSATSNLVYRLYLLFRFPFFFFIKCHYIWYGWVFKVSHHVMLSNNLDYSYCRNLQHFSVWMQDRMHPVNHLKRHTANSVFRLWVLFIGDILRTLSILFVRCLCAIDRLSSFQMHACILHLSLLLVISVYFFFFSFHRYAPCFW